MALTTPELPINDYNTHIKPLIKSEYVTTTHKLYQLALTQALKPKDRKTFTGDYVLANLNKHKHRLQRETVGTAPAQSTPHSSLWEGNHLKQLIATATFMSWLGLQGNKGAAPLGLAAMYVHALLNLTTLHAKVPEQYREYIRKAVYKAMLYSWGLGINLTIQEACGTTGTVFAMLDVDRPTAWWSTGPDETGFEFSSYKLVVLGILVRQPLTRLEGGKDQASAAYCPYCQRYVYAKATKYTHEQAIGVHLFMCPFSSKDYGKTLIQNQPDIGTPLDHSPNNYQQCKVCLGPVPDRQHHEPLCAARWLNTPKIPTLTFWEGHCEKCGTVYLPGKTYNMPPYINITKTEATSVENKDWVDTVLMCHKRAHEVQPIANTPQTAPVDKVVRIFQVDQYLQIGTQQIMGRPAQINTTYSKAVITLPNKHTDTIDEETLETYVRTVYETKGYYTPVPGVYTSGIKVPDNALKELQPLTASPALSAIWTGEYSKYLKHPLPPVLRFIEIVYINPRPTAIPEATLPKTAKYKIPKTMSGRDTDTSGTDDTSDEDTDTTIEEDVTVNVKTKKKATPGPKGRKTPKRKAKSKGRSSSRGSSKRSSRGRSSKAKSRTPKKKSKKDREATEASKLNIIPCVYA